MLASLATANLLKNVSKIGIASTTNLFHTSQICNKRRKGCGPNKVAVVLCGCGVLDGTEISEAVSVAIHLSSKGIVPKFYAPDINLCGPVNHFTKDPEECSPPKNALVEGARLARADIRPLCECTACDNDGLVIPGGWGAARTLSDFGAKGCDCVVLPDLERVIKEFHCAQKPIGAMCIGAAVVAKVLNGVKVTLGKDCPKDQWAYSDAIEKVKQMGATVELRDVKSITHCKDHDVFTTPAWLDTKATYADVHEGIGKLVGGMKKCIK